MEQQVLTRDYLKEKVPAVFAKKPLITLSDRYTHVSTEKIVDYFGEMGWHPVTAFQAKNTKKAVDPNVKKHLIRFANEKYDSIMKNEGSLSPNLLLMNSHNGTSKVWLAAGIFRMVCANGLVVADNMFGSVLKRHSGERDEIFEAVYKVERNFENVWSKVDEYCSIQLTQRQRLDFAVKAIELNWGENTVITPEEVLKTRRVEDENKSLWSTFNVLQENIMKGGVQYMRPFRGVNKIRQTREIKNDIRNVNFNSELWMLMEAFRTNRHFKVR